MRERNGDGWGVRCRNAIAPRLPALPLISLSSPTRPRAHAWHPGRGRQPRAPSSPMRPRARAARPTSGTAFASGLTTMKLATAYLGIGLLTLAGCSSEPAAASDETRSFRGEVRLDVCEGERGPEL